MRRSLHIVITAALAAICVLPAAGQNYKRNKVKAEPEPLTFSRIIMSDKEIDPNLRETTRGWDSNECRIETITYWDTFDDNYMSYVGRFDGLNADEEVFDLVIWMKLIYENPHKLTLHAYEITAFSAKHPVMDLSVNDTRLNRPWLWRAFHNIDTIDKQRKIAEDCFNYVADSLEDFIRNGPPMELQRID